MPDNTISATLRGTEVIAAEINAIKSQVRQTAFSASVEIGKRLSEAKEKIPYGEWGEWLDTQVNYSQRTANNLMKIFREFGAESLAVNGKNTLSQALANLDYTSLVSLSALDDESRAEVMENNNIEAMTSRELTEAISAKKRAEKARNEALEALNAERLRTEALETERRTYTESYDKRLRELEQELKDSENSGGVTDEKVKKLLEEKDTERLAAVSEARKLADEKFAAENDKRIRVTEKLKAEISALKATAAKQMTDMEKALSLAEARVTEAERKASVAAAVSDKDMARFSAYAEQIQASYNGCLKILRDADDEDKRSRLRGAAEKILERLRGALETMQF